MNEEATYATLWDRERLEYSGDQINKLNSDISYDVQIFLERAYFANAAEFDIDKLGGEEQLVKVSNEIDMITAVMQLTEAIVVDPDNYSPGQIEQMRHKIVDRIVSLHLCE
jgi:argonaute-like protein implicated in RNA metabolism and viral defense